jgi:hypothetical protein
MAFMTTGDNYSELLENDRDKYQEFNFVECADGVGMAAQAALMPAICGLAVACINLMLDFAIKSMAKFRMPTT